MGSGANFTLKGCYVNLGAEAGKIIYFFFNFFLASTTYCQLGSPAFCIDV